MGQSMLWSHGTTQGHKDTRNFIELESRNTIKPERGREKVCVWTHTDNQTANQVGQRQRQRQGPGNERHRLRYPGWVEEKEQRGTFVQGMGALIVFLWFETPLV